MAASDVHKLYIAFFHRPADVAGLTYWEAQATLNGGAAAIERGLINSLEYKSLHAGKSNVEVIDAIYLNLFGRHAEPTGLNYWGTLLDNQTLGVGNIAMAIILGAQDLDSLTMENKFNAAAQFTANLDTSAEINAYAGTAASTIAAEWLGAITDSPESFARAMATLDATISRIVSPPPVVQPSPVSQTFVLTTGVDAFHSGAAADLFLANTGTLTSGDVLNGGGGHDILSIGASGQSLVGATLTSIEEIRLVNNGTLNADISSLGSFAFGHAATTDTGNVTLAINLVGATSFDLSGVTAGQAGTASSGINSIYSNAGMTALNATLTGLADSFAGTADADTIKGGAGNDTIDGGAGADTIEGGSDDDRIVFATADQDVVDGGAGRDTLVVTGGTLIVDLTATAGPITNFEVVDASALFGSILITNVNTNPASTTAFTVVGSRLADTIVTGAGNDVITMGFAGETIAYDVLSAGSGKDTLILIGNITTGTPSQNVIDLASVSDQFGQVNNAPEHVAQTGFENVDLTGVIPGTGSGFTITAHSGGSNIAGTSLADLITGGAGDDTVFGIRGPDILNGGGGNNTLVLINGGTAGAFTGTNVQSSGVVGLTDSALINFQTIVLSGSSSISLSLNGQTEALVISASTATAAATIDSGSGNDIIAGSSLADFITGGLGADILTGGGGADTFRFNANGSVVGIAMDVITDFTANSDQLSFGTSAVLHAADASALAAGLNVQQSVGGLLTFAAGDNTLSLKTGAVQADIQLDAARSLAFFVHGQNTYVYFSGNSIGNADDMIIELTGVTSLTTITAGLTSTIA